MAQFYNWLYCVFGDIKRKHRHRTAGNVGRLITDTLLNGPPIICIVVMCCVHLCTEHVAVNVIYWVGYKGACPSTIVHVYL